MRRSREAAAQPVGVGETGSSRQSGESPETLLKVRLPNVSIHLLLTVNSLCLVLAALRGECRLTPYHPPTWARTGALRRPAWNGIELFVFSHGTVRDIAAGRSHLEWYLLPVWATI